MGIGRIAYMNGVFDAPEALHLSPFDRGSLFAHSAYEVTAVYDGKMVDFAGHVARLARTLDGIAIPNPHDAAAWQALHEALIARNGLREGVIYLQVTAGAYGFRDFAGPEVIDPSVFMYADARPLIGSAAQHGIRAITLPDTRWARRDFKTTQLLSQALAYRAAREAGCETALMVEDGVITEAASANLWVVDANGTLITRDLSSTILPGITRQAVIDHANQKGLKVDERAVTVDEAYAAAEVFTSSAGAMIAPVIAIDGHPIGSGAPGRMTRLVQRLYYTAMGANLGQAAPWAIASKT